jgi:hypothetical protein
LKEIIIEKELEGKLKRRTAKKKFALEKKKIINRYVFQGLKLDVSLAIAKSASINIIN